MVEGPHRPECGFPVYDGIGCDCANAIERSEACGFVGQRMSLHLSPGTAAHEMVDDAGIIYGIDGSRTTWYRRDRRAGGPGWYVK